MSLKMTQPEHHESRRPMLKRSKTEITRPPPIAGCIAGIKVDLVCGFTWANAPLNWSLLILLGHIKM